MTLKEARIVFSFYFTKLCQKASELGFDYAYDEITQHQKKGHMAGSLHYSGCAGDLILYKNGIWLKKTEDYQELGEYWELLNSDCKWGGRFTTPDGGHFSFAPIEVFGGRA
jgi:hypothetical protein